MTLYRMYPESAREILLQSLNDRRVCVLEDLKPLTRFEHEGIHYVRVVFPESLNAIFAAEVGLYLGRRAWVWALDLAYGSIVKFSPRTLVKVEKND